MKLLVNPVPTRKGFTRIHRDFSIYTSVCLRAALGVRIRRVLPVEFHIGFHIIIQVLILIH